VLAISAAVLLGSTFAVVSRIVPASAQGEGSLSGTVTSNSGADISGAVVEALDPTTGADDGSATTGSDGSYSFNIADGTYDLQVTAPAGSGYSAEDIDGVVVDGASTKNVVLIPAGATMVSGQLTDSFGQDVSGAGVALGCYGAVTDAMGNYSLEVPPGTTSDMFVGGDPCGGTGAEDTAPANTASGAGGYDPMSFGMVDLASQDVTADTVLDYAVPIVGVAITVDNSAGQPQSGVSVYTQSAQQDLTIPTGQDVAANAASSGTTGSNGVAYLTLISGLTYSAYLTPPASDPTDVETTVNSIDINGGTTGYTAVPETLTAGITISGQVTDSFGQDVSGAGMYLWAGSSDPRFLGVTDSEGDYTINVPPGVTGDYMWINPGYCGAGVPTTEDAAPADAASGQSGYAPVGFCFREAATRTITASTIINYEIPVARVAMTVRNSAGQPQPGVSVSIQGPDGTDFTLPSGQDVELAGGGESSGTTNSSGVVYLTAISGLAYTATLIAPDSDPADGEDIVTGIPIDGDTTLTERLTAKIVVSGQVTDSFGQDVVGAGMVVVTGGNEGYPRYLTNTDSDGNYSVEVPALSGEVVVNAATCGYGGALTNALDTAPADAASGPDGYEPAHFCLSETSNRTIDASTTLNYEIPAARVAITVDDSAGNPTPDVNVVLSGGGDTTIRSGEAVGASSESSGTTNASGVVYLTELYGQGLAYTATLTPPAGDVQFANDTVSDIAIGSSGYASTYVLTSVAPETISVTPPTATVTPGTTQQYDATGTYANSATVDITDDVTWSSSDPSVATVDPSTGLATAVSGGQTTITATSGGTSASATLIVVGGPTTIATAVTDATNGEALPAGSAVTGDNVYDTATVSPQSAQLADGFAEQAARDIVSDGQDEGETTPGGTVTFNLYEGSCPSDQGSSGTLIVGPGTETLSGGVATSQLSGALAAGSYYYETSYSGNTDYADSSGPCEPFSVSADGSAVSTAVTDNTNGEALPAGSAVTGDNVYDTATVSPGRATVVKAFDHRSTSDAITPTGTVTFDLYQGSCPSNGDARQSSGGTLVGGPDTETLSGGVATSQLSGALVAGSYYYESSFTSGDPNYSNSTGPCEALSVGAATPVVSTAVTDNSNGEVLPAGSAVTGDSVYDTATLSEAITPTGTVTFDLYQGSCPSNAVAALQDSGGTLVAGPDTETLSGGVATSQLSGALAAGSYYYETSFTSGDSNYSNSTGPCEPFTVGPAALTVTASSPQMTYGGSVPAVGATITGFVAGFGIGTLTTSPSCSTTASRTSAVGQYDTSCTGAADPDYTISYKDGTLAVGPAPLSVTAPSQSMIYGGRVPKLSPSYVGFVNGESSSSLTTQPTCSTTASSTSAVGRYATSCSGAADANYTISYTDGSLRVERDPTTTVVSSDSDPSESGKSVTFTATVSAEAPGAGVPSGEVTFSLTEPAGHAVTLSCASVVLSDAAASCEIPAGVLFAMSGPYEVSASYGGNLDFATSSGETTQHLVYAAVSATESASSTSPNVDSKDTITITATNAASASASSGEVMLTGMLPNGLHYSSASPSTGTVSVSGQTVSWTIPDLAPGSSARLRIVVGVETTKSVSSLVNFTQTTPDAAGSVAGRSNTVTLKPSYAILRLTQTVSDPQPEIGAADVFSLTVTNLGPDAAEEVVVTDPVPSELAITATSTSKGATSTGSGGQTVRWDVGTLAVGTSAVLRADVTVDAPGTLVDTATVGDSTFDPQGKFKRATASVLATAPVVVPPTHAGEPWSGWAYWWLMTLVGLAGGALLLLTRRRRKLPA
jgi:uncharacterized repeat protein (TIGR01451 family)